MDKPLGRGAPICYITKSEVIQLRPPINEAEYDYCVDQLRPPIAKLSYFKKSDRFDNNGIFGDLYDTRRESRFGQPKLSTLNIDKANDAIDAF